MCIVIDTNTFASIFEAGADDHEEFRPILDWIHRGRGKIVYGGTKYKEELHTAKKYLRIFIELKKASKIVEISNDEVDREQERIEQLINHRDFDDPHLIAIISISRCKLICSKDQRAYPFIKNRSLYPPRMQCPKIYNRSSNSNLLCDRNIVECCRQD